MEKSTLHEHLNLKPNHVKTISKNIASAIYQSEKVSQKYTNTIILLRNLCVNDTNHLTINGTNCHCFLDTLKPIIDEHTDKSEMLVSDTNCNTLSSAISDYFDNLNTFHTKLLQRRNKDSVTTNLTLNKPHTEHRLLQNEITLNGDEVGLVYALLNVPDASEMLLCTLSNWARRPQSKIDNVACLQYLWENLDSLTEPVQAVVLDNFVYVLEKTVIKECTEVLRGDGDRRRLLSLRTLNKRALGRIKSIIYSLYVYSGCNNKILELLNIFE